MYQVSKEIADIIRLAISQVQRRQGLFKCTSFSRINVSKSSTDPLSGLFLIPWFQVPTLIFLARNSVSNFVAILSVPRASRVSDRELGEKDMVTFGSAHSTSCTTLI